MTILGYADGGGNSAEDLALGKERANIAWTYLVIEKQVSESVANDSASGESESEIQINFE